MTNATSCIQSASAAFQIRPASERAIAPWWHTLVLIAIFLLMAAGGAMRQSQAGSRANLVAARPNLSGLYLSLIAGEWALVYYVWKVGLRRTGTTIGELIGGKWASPKAALLDVLWAGGLWTLWKGAYFVWWTWFGTGHSTSISRLMPQGQRNRHCGCCCPSAQGSQRNLFSAVTSSVSSWLGLGASQWRYSSK